MSPTLRNVVLFSGGIIFPAAVILLHECGHFAAGYLSGFKMSFHYAEVRFTTPGEISDQALVVVTAAGPGVEASLAAGGFLWLRRARRARRQEIPTAGDWMATACALSAGRWLRCFAGTPTNPQPTDEALLSRALGLPGWFLPYMLAPFAIALLVAIIRLHPAGARRSPFSSFVAGAMGGLLLWMKIIGPLCFS